MNLEIQVRRHDPDSGKPPYDQVYAVEAEPTDRLLDVLLRIKESQDGTLSFRYSCAHGVCGSDAMRINGREALACKTIVGDVVGAGGAAGEPTRISLEPLRHMPVLRDLMVDQEDFFDRALAVTPYLLPASGVSGKERIQAPQEHDQFEDASKCINCGACFSACPVLETNPRFIGPAAIVQAARFVEDSRDVGLAPRLDALDTPDGIWACENHFECTRVCPREIKVTKLINLMKRRVTEARAARGESVHAAPERGN